MAHRAVLAVYALQIASREEDGSRPAFSAKAGFLIGMKITSAYGESGWNAAVPGLGFPIRAAVSRTLIADIVYPGHAFTLLPRFVHLL